MKTLKGGMPIDSFFIGNKGQNSKKIPDDFDDWCDGHNILFGEAGASFM